MMIAGAMHPPFSLFLTGEKERMRRARWKREKDGDALRRRGTVQTVLVRKSPGRGAVQAGVLEVDVRTVRLSSLPLTWRFIKMRGPAGFARQALASYPPAGDLLLFLFWTVHGPFSLFLLEEKEKMGGAKNQPSSWLLTSPPVRAGASPPLPKRPLTSHCPQ